MSMRACLRGSRVALQSHTTRCRPVSTDLPLLLPWKEFPPLIARFHSRRSSTTASHLSSSDSPSSSETPPAPEDDKLKAKRSYTRKTEKDTKESSNGLPPDLDILWNCNEWPTPSPSDLPPEELLSDALNSLLVCLHPHAQRRALYPTNLEPPIEPTLALYCPIEGGDYVIDNTVRELAKRAGAEVIVLDSVQLAGGQWGQFGKANALELPANPLHFHSMLSTSTPHSNILENDEEEEEIESFASPHAMTIHVAGFVPIRTTRQTVITSSHRNSLASRRKAFLDDVVNFSPQAASDSPTSPEPHKKPRIVYIRDYPTLSSSNSIWFGPLLSAIRTRRQGAINRSPSQIANPTVIVLGIPAPLWGAASHDLRISGPQHGGFYNTRSRRYGSADLGAKNDWSEDLLSQKARERRLRERLRKWERGVTELRDELPPSPLANALTDSSGSSESPQLLVVPGQGGLSGMMSSHSTSQNRLSSGRGIPDGGVHYFRTSVVVPADRNLVAEKTTRTARRREINEIVMRMAVGSVGGSLDKMDDHQLNDESLSSSSRIDTKTGRSMLEHWDSNLEDWSYAKEVADKAVGAVLAGNKGQAVLLHDTTSVSWSDVHNAWKACQSSRDARRLWVEQICERGVPESDDSSREASSSDETEPVDEAFEALKRDSHLTMHERRLLNCYVAPGLLNTTFSQVHLPDHTIDSVRSIVSLPLLHPQAFSQGVLKDHTMTGALLFGPPGTGKTLLARALAKESGARMLIIKPSDVMDMYVGEGEKLVRSVFSLARRLNPCIVFLDEIDALLGARVTSRDNGGAFALRGVITEFMQEMDGLVTNHEQTVVIIGATNRPFDLDDAVLRRLPRRILVDLPGEQEREAILRIILRDENLGDDIELRAIARRTLGFSGSDLKHLCVSAALDAVKERVSLPWTVPKPSSAISSTHEINEDNGQPQNSRSTTVPNPESPRVLAKKHFTKAYNEITPSASESSATLAELRKWNEQFGEGAKEGKKKLWGVGRFGFTNPVGDNSQ